MLLSIAISVIPIKTNAQSVPTPPADGLDLVDPTESEFSEDTFTDDFSIDYDSDNTTDDTTDTTIDTEDETALTETTDDTTELTTTTTPTTTVVEDTPTGPDSVLVFVFSFIATLVVLLILKVSIKKPKHE